MSCKSPTELRIYILVFFGHWPSNAEKNLFFSFPPLSAVYFFHYTRTKFNVHKKNAITIEKPEINYISDYFCSFQKVLSATRKQVFGQRKFAQIYSFKLSLNFSLKQVVKAFFLTKIKQLFRLVLIKNDFQRTNEDPILCLRQKIEVNCN